MKIVGRAGQQQFDANLARHVMRVVRQDAERCLTDKKQHIDSRTTFLSCLVVVRLCIFPFFFFGMNYHLSFIYMPGSYICAVDVPSARCVMNDPPCPSFHSFGLSINSVNYKHLF
jgi:hypothetical protein